MKKVKTNLLPTFEFQNYFKRFFGNKKLTEKEKRKKERKKERKKDIKLNECRK